MNLKKIISDYIDESGCTWYTPSAKERYHFEKAVHCGIVVQEGNQYSLPGIANEENTIAKYIITKLHHNESGLKTYPIHYLDMFITLYEMQEGIKLDTWQKDAVYLAMNNNLFVLTGGPGTGKTSVLKCIYFCIQKILKTNDILFTAPTGKAARRITESVQCNAYTVAKVLGLKDSFSKPKALNNKCIIVDEVSMLDTKTAHALFTAVAMDSKLILVGDVEQLPSIGYGSVLRDLIDAGIPCTKLEKTFRQASESGLFANIEQIKNGLHNGFIERSDFKVFTAQNMKQAKDIMVREFSNAIARFGMGQVVCLTPYRRKGEACAIQLNNILQNIVNPPRKEKHSVSYRITEDTGFTYDITLREGDPVMQLVNALKVANGDVGYVYEIDPIKKIVKVEFMDCIVTYRAKQLSELTLAYAISVHKSQGAEYKCVITSALEEDMDMLSRNTIYTAVTRAKQECIIVTNGKTAQNACKIESGYERITRLKQSIKFQEEKYKLLSSVLSNV